MWTRYIERCLDIRREDRVIIIADKNVEPLSRELYRYLKANTNVYLTFLEDHGERPMTRYPWSLEEYVNLVKPTTSIFMASTREGEFPMRKDLIQHLLSFNVRHAHMPGFDERVIVGMKECERVVDITLRVFERLKDAREIHVEGEETNLYVKVGKYRWVADTGKIERGSWGNLPAGEVFTTPVEVEGHIKIEELGDYFVKYGILKDLILYFEKGELVDVKGEKGDELLKYVEEYPGVGEFALGTNISIPELTGNLLADEKIPGVHLAIGDPLGDHTGAEWSAPIHVDALFTRATVYVNGEIILREGRYEG